jgi:SAM-dependent methyltransferase
MIRDYLTDLLNAYWFAPPVALWRAAELRALARGRFERPLLDLGCGDGLIARALFPPGEPVDAGFDPWPEQVRRAARSGCYRHVELAVGQRLPYADGAFATVLSNSVLEHIPDVVPVVREAGRVLAPGGRFCCTVPSDAFREMLDGYARRAVNGDAAGANAYADGVDRWLAHHHYYTPAEWRDVLAGAGMRLVEAEYYMPAEVVRLWDRANQHYGVNGARSTWRLLASPRVRLPGYRSLLRHLVVRRLGRRWRRYHEMGIPAGEKGGGLLVVGRKEER